ncbi:uncharacterized protein LOC114277843 [Camellia sinensis]|uniref:uncharacterized protein LOC114277843 n=1 Tax=Camellia sinensis TaxID=4442 RepID=UPI001036D3DF|nr:uncharacterized protein LOC114277843 [Camellia sinensis]
MQKPPIPYNQKPLLQEQQEYIRWCEAEMKRLREEALHYKNELEELKLQIQLEKDEKELRKTGKFKAEELEALEEEAEASEQLMMMETVANYFKAQRRRRQAHARQNFPCPYKHCREKGLIEYEGITAVHFVRLCPEAKGPSRSTDGAVGYDLSSTAKIFIQPQDRCLIPTGIALQIPFGMYGRIAPRSGLALQHGIHVGAGVIDPDYRGEVKVLLFNFDLKMFKIQPGQRIAQIIFEKVALPRMVEQDGFLDITGRGTSGFGHSGMASEPKEKWTSASKERRNSSLFTLMIFLYFHLMNRLMRSIST